VLTEEERAALEEKIRYKLAEKKKLKHVKVRAETKDEGLWSAISSMVPRETPAKGNENPVAQTAKEETAKEDVLKKEVDAQDGFAKTVEDSMSKLKEELGEKKDMGEVLKLLSEIRDKANEQAHLPATSGDGMLVAECEALRGELKMLQDKLEYYENDRQLLLEQIETLNTSLKNLTEFLNKVQKQSIEQPPLLASKPKERWWKLRGHKGRWWGFWRHREE